MPPTRSNLPNFRIVSGGQTGVDRGALDAAMEMGVAYGGWCPKNRRAEDGVIPDCYALLQEIDSTNYSDRTEKNVLDSDGTLICYRQTLFGGSQLTMELAQAHGKPFCLVDLDIEIGSEDDIAAWIKHKNIRVLNCAGPRESDCLGIQEQSRDFFMRLLSRIERA